MFLAASAAKHGNSKFDLIGQPYPRAVYKTRDMSCGAETASEGAEQRRGAHELIRGGRTPVTDRAS